MYRYLVNRCPWLGSLIAIPIFAASVALRLTFIPVLGARIPYLTFFPAVMLASLLGGLYAGFLVTVLSAGYVAYFLCAPIGQFSVHDHADLFGQVIFLLSGFMVSWISESTRRAQKRAGEAEAQVGLALEREKASAALHQSEARFRSYVEHSPIAVFVVDREGRYVDFNTAATDLLGYATETLKQMHMLEVHPIEDHAVVLRELSTLFLSGRMDLEARLLKADGTAIWVSLHAVCLDSGRAIAYCQDITGLKVTVESMRERLALQEQLAAISAVVPGMIHSFRLKPDGSFCFPYASPGVESIYGVRPEDLVFDATAAIALIHPDDQERVQQSVTLSAQSLTPWRNEFRVMHPRRGEIWVEGHSIPDREADGSILWQGFLHDVTSRKRIEEMMLETSRRLDFAIKSGGLGVWEWNLVSGTMVWNDRMCELYGIAAEAFDGTTKMWSGALHPDDRDRVWACCQAALGADNGYNAEFRVVHADGKVKTLKADAVVLRDGNGRPLRMIGLTRDLTEQRCLEAQLLQAQKMEAIGRLAGGVAHDFNNNLSVMLGYAELAKLEPLEMEQFHEYLDEIIKAAVHSREVTQQLLAFSRNELIAPREVDLNQLILHSDKALWRLVGEDVRLNLTTCDGIWAVLLDPAQVNQIAINLVLNARDAMPNGGTLSVETANLVLEGNAAMRDPQIPAGEYVRLTVRDTGIGMDRELQKRIFEPFFTTKEVGKGSGLGLATVYGIVSQNGGFIKVESEPGRGSTFSLFFPRMMTVPAAEAPKPQPVPAGAGSTVLLVEDEASVKLMVQLMLQRAGYLVQVADSPQHALELCRSSEGHFDCLLTDVIMPEMNGVELSAEVRALRPEIGIVYMSGYTADMIAQHGVLEPGVIFVQKPFDLVHLSEKIQQAILFSRTP